jgi:methyl-accepting chemotaxis protein
VKKVSDIIAEIATASEEQSSGIEQINNAITQMDQAVQQNAALVEQAAAASESMSDQGQGLTQLMDFFKNGSAIAASRPGNPERRSVNRPWSKPVKSAASEPAPTKRAAGDDWQEV